MSTLCCPGCGYAFEPAEVTRWKKGYTEDISGARHTETERRPWCYRCEEYYNIPAPVESAAPTSGESGGGAALPIGAVADVEQILIDEYATCGRFECGNVAEKIVRALFTPTSPAPLQGGEA